MEPNRSASVPTLVPGEFWGECRSRRRLHGLTVTDYRYPAAVALAPHRHEQAYLSVVLAGGYDEVSERVRRACAAGTVTLHPAGERHADRFREIPTRILSVEFDAGWMSRRSGVATALEEPREWHGGPVSRLALRLHRELDGADAATPIAVEGLVCEILAALLREPLESRLGPRPPAWLGRVRERIADDAGVGCTLGELAEDAGVHPAHLSRVFRRHCGSSVGEAIRARRIEVACGRLREARLPLAEIALDAGFAHQSHFTSCFRRHTGMTPAEYRRSFASRSPRDKTLRSR